MRLSSVPLSLLASLCLLLPPISRPVSADPAPPTNLRPDILYTHRGEFVQVKPMRPLTLNAHITEFAYDPLGIEIAYSGSNVESDKTTYFVKTVDTRTGHELSQITLTAPTEDRNTALSLIGWSVSGKYLLLKKFAPDPNQPDTAVLEFLRWDLSTNPPTTRIIQPQSALPSEQQSVDLAGSADCYPSPTGRWLAFTQSIHTQKPDGKRLDSNAYLLYDPEHDTFKPLVVPPEATLYTSWLDAGHLEVYMNPGLKQLNVITGQISPLPLNAEADKPKASRQYPDLSLETESRDVNDLKSIGAQAPTYIVWIRRAPFAKMPLGSAAAGVMPRGQASDSGGFDALSVPQAIWCPSGKQLAFAANGDLYVTDLVSVTDGVPHEKMAVGLKLSCEEEQRLAMSNLKQIGLGIIQYAQDFDEHFPPAEDVNETIYPYIKSRDVFGFGGHNFVYKAPKDLSFAAMDAPADTELGFIDLPCSRVVLFADGHVKVFAK